MVAYFTQISRLLCNRTFKQDESACANLSLKHKWYNFAIELQDDGNDSKADISKMAASLMANFCLCL